MFDQLNSHSNIVTRDMVPKVSRCDIADLRDKNFQSLLKKRIDRKTGLFGLNTILHRNSPLKQ